MDKEGVRMEQDDLILQIEASVKFLVEYEKEMKRPDYGDWEDRFLRETDKLIDRNLRIRKDNLLNFRGRQIFVADRPRACIRGFYNSSMLYYEVKKIINLIMGHPRGGIREAFDAFEVLDAMDFLGLLKKYPNPDIGRPLNIEHKGYCFTNRYIRHVYLLGLFKQYLEKEVGEDSIFLDIGSSYGIFSSLVKQEIPKSHHVLVDMPGQLILAHFYLGLLFPEAKIAGFKEVGNANKIDKDLIRKFDFLLLPTSMYDKLTAHSVDVVTNFISLSEMSRHWFDTYINSGVFKTAPFLYTVNRYDAYPTYHNNITILDYPLSDYKTMYMRTCPFLRYYYQGFLLFWYKRINYPSQFFQFIGKRCTL